MNFLDDDKGFYKIRQCGYGEYQYCNGFCEDCKKSYQYMRTTNKTEPNKYPYTYLNHSILNDRRV